LDLKLRQAMQVELKRIQREVGITFVYVTHDQSEALTMSDRIAVINNGGIEHLGTPRDIYEHPATKFVAGFIGTSNLFGGRVSHVEGDRAVIEFGPDERIVVPVREGVSMTAGSSLEVTVRPEKINLSLSAPATSNGSAIRGTVTEVVYLGTATSYNITTSSGSDVVVFTQNSSNSEDIAVRGNSVWLTWSPQHSYAIGEK
jgi:spermidine/putrescine transport system ATP-binding protein